VRPVRTPKLGQKEGKDLIFIPLSSTPYDAREAVLPAHSGPGYARKLDDPRSLFMASPAVYISRTPPHQPTFVCSSTTTGSVSCSSFSRAASAVVFRSSYTSVSPTSNLIYSNRDTLTHLTTNEAPIKANTTTIIVILPFFQYGTSVAGYMTMPHQVYSTCPPVFIVYRITARTASSPPFWVIVVAQPYKIGLTIKLVPLM
jgi:hypothetical protein